MKLSTWQTNDVPKSVIQVECQGNILKFGAMLPDEVKSFIAEATRRTLAGGYTGCQKRLPKGRAWKRRFQGVTMEWIERLPKVRA